LASLRLGGAPPAIRHLELSALYSILRARRALAGCVCGLAFTLFGIYFVVLSAAALRAGRLLDSTGPPNASLWAPTWWRFLHCGHTKPADPRPSARARAHLWTCTPNDVGRTPRQRARARAPQPPVSAPFWQLFDSPISAGAPARPVPFAPGRQRHHRSVSAARPPTFTRALSCSGRAPPNPAPTRVRPNCDPVSADFGGHGPRGGFAELRGRAEHERRRAGRWRCRFTRAAARCCSGEAALRRDRGGVGTAARRVECRPVL